MKKFMNRRNFIKTSAVLGTAASIMPSSLFASASNKLQVVKYQWKIYRFYQNLGIIKSIYYMLHYAYYGFRKY